MPRPTFNDGVSYFLCIVNKKHSLFLYVSHFPPSVSMEVIEVMGVSDTNIFSQGSNIESAVRI